MSLRCFIYITFLSLNMLTAISANAGTTIKISRPIQLSNGSVADIEKIRSLIRHVHDLDVVDSSSISLRIQFVSDQIIDQIIEACGEGDYFIDFFENHKFLPYTLNKEESLFLGRCMYGIFDFLDGNLDFPAPGLYRKFDHTYIRDGIQLGYQCGYRTQRLFSYFALSIWLNHHQDMKNDRRFICLGDLNAAQAYSELGLMFGVRRISDEALFFQNAFEDWGDALRYISYSKLVRENRRKSVCDELISEPHSDTKTQDMLLNDNQCSQPETARAWRK